jgi:DDE superfamily endonuclease
VLWNPKAYCNEDTMLYWVQHIYQFSFAYATTSVKREPRLLCLDAFIAYLTPAVGNALKRQGVTISVIPRGCTGYVQPLDVSLNKPLKDLIKEEQDDHFDKHIKE